MSLLGKYNRKIMTKNLNNKQEKIHFYLKFRTYATFFSLQFPSIAKWVLKILYSSTLQLMILLNWFEVSVQVI